MLKDSTKWYTSWFDTTYYHILYRDRDHQEAIRFMDTLTQYLNLSSEETILDLACGKGRHSIHLNTLGYTVTGVDLSQNSIDYATQFENESLQFRVHDMRFPFLEKFNAVFNLFTSFGYFEQEEDNLNTIKAIKTNLAPGGIGVIDFMNVEYSIHHLIAEETKTVDSIDFNIKRYLKEGYIYKDIQFTDQGTSYTYTEKVKAITLDDFKHYFEQAGITLLEVFGSYTLEKFNRKTSKRLILIFTSI